MPSNVDAEFKVHVLSKFIRDKVGQLYSSDATLMSFGQRLYTKMKAKRDKKTEVKRSVRCDMRRVGTLFVAFVDECQQQLRNCFSSVTIPDTQSGDNTSRSHGTCRADVINSASFISAVER